MKLLSRLILIIAVFICVQAHAAPATIAWTDSFDPLVGDTSADRVTAAGGIAYVAGAGPFRGSPGSNADIRVRAYAINSGNLLWEDVWDAGGIRQDDEVTDAVAAGMRLFITGSSGTNTAGSNAWVVRAYDRRNGQVLWEDHCGQFNSRAKAVATDTRRVYVAGICSPAPAGTGLVRAYSNTGTQLWQVNDIAFPQDVAVMGKQVLVAGADADGSLIVHAYSSDRGKLQWEARPARAQTLSLRSAQVMGGEGLIFLAWEAVDNNGQAAHEIAGYNARNGALRWRVDPGDRVNDLTSSAGRVFAAQQGTEVLVSAYDASRGKLLWRDQPGTPATPYSALAVTTGDSQVLVAGQAYDPATDTAPHFMVRAYDPHGQLLWEDETPTTTVQGAEAPDIAWEDGVAVAAGMDSRSEPPFGTTHWLVRAYSASRHRRGP